MKKKKSTKKKNIMENKKKIITIISVLLITIALVILGFKLFGDKTDLETGEKNIDTSKFPATLSTVIEGESLGSMSTAFFHHKYNDKYSLICTQFRKTTPAGHSCKIFTDKNQWDDKSSAAIAAIVDNATGGKNGKMSNLNKYYYAELAVNQYLWEENGKVSGSSQYVGNIGNSSEVQTLVALARKAGVKAKTTFNIVLSPSSPKLTQSGEYYVSDPITVKDEGGYLDSYTVTVTGIDVAEIIDKTANSFKVRIPVSKVKTGSTANITVKVTGKKTYKIAAKYDCGTNLQTVTPSYTIEETKTNTKSVNLSVSRTKITIAKTDNSGNYIAGAVLNLKNSDGTYNKDFTTKTSPIVIEDLAYGTYTLSEKTAPSGYIKSSETKKLVLSANSLSVTGTITNQKNGFTVSKRSKSTSTEIAGAVLQITDANGKVVDKWTTTNTKKSFSGYKAGTYYLEELQAPNGYVKFNGKIKFIVGEDGKITTNSGTDSEVVLVNDPNQFLVSKKSIDVEGEIPGAILRIVDANNKEIIRWTTTTSKKSISMLPVGTYYLEEIQAPAGYKKSDVRVKFVLDENGKITTESGSATEVIFINDPIEATFSKVDIANSKELPGAQLQILDENEKEIKDSKGEVLYKWISTDKPHVISKIPAGKYVLVETQEPEGYVLSQEKIAFEIDAYGNIKVDGKETEKVVMKNEKTKVLISKQDVTNGEELPGAQLQVLDASGKVLDKWVSTKDPHMIEGLKVGKYYLIETIAPNGYVLSEEKIEFEIKNDGTVDMVVMLNTPIVDVPNTASAASIIISVIGIIAVGFGGWMIYKNVKKAE